MWVGDGLTRYIFVFHSLTLSPLISFSPLSPPTPPSLTFSPAPFAASPLLRGTVSRSPVRKDQIRDEVRCSDNGKSSGAHFIIFINPNKRRRPSWVDLPVELTAKIFQRLTVKDIFKTAQVCTTWLSVCRDDPSFWRSVDLWDRNAVDQDRTRDWPRICREVVNRSQGQLVSINLGYFANDNLLLYIAHRAKQLRHLRIRSTCVSDEGFSKAVNEFPLLEELQLEYCAISKKSIEAAAQSCLFFKSFSFIKIDNKYRKPSDEEADAIAENMRLETPFTCWK